MKIEQPPEGSPESAETPILPDVVQGEPEPAGSAAAPQPVVDVKMEGAAGSAAPPHVPDDEMEGDPVGVATAPKYEGGPEEEEGLPPLLRDDRDIVDLPSLIAAHKREDVG